MSCSSRMPLPRFSRRLMARWTICDGEMWRSQSSATTSTLNTISERLMSASSTAGERPRPGMRKNGASLSGSPRPRSPTRCPGRSRSPVSRRSVFRSGSGDPGYGCRSNGRLHIPAAPTVGNDLAISPTLKYVTLTHCAARMSRILLDEGGNGPSSKSGPLPCRRAAAFADTASCRAAVLAEWMASTRLVPMRPGLPGQVSARAKLAQQCDENTLGRSAPQRKR